MNQREMAAIAPHDKNVHIVGSDDATTCIIVVVRHSGESLVAHSLHRSHLTERDFLFFIFS